MTGCQILHRSRGLVSIGSEHVVAVGFRFDRATGMDGYWCIFLRRAPRSEIGRGKTLRQALRAADIDRETFKNGKA